MKSLPLLLLLFLSGCNTNKSSPTPAQSAEPADTHQERFLVTVGGKKGFIDRTGRIIINPQYELVYGFSEGLAIICVGECDTDHIAGFRASKDPSKLFDEVEQSYKEGFIDESGKIVINPVYESAYNFSEGLASVCSGKGCYSSLGREKREKKWGYIDRTGAMVIPLQFDDADEFHEGLASVSVGGKWGYISKGGKFVINPQFDLADRFKDGIAQVGVKVSDKETKFGYIDNSGKYVWQPSD